MNESCAQSLKIIWCIISVTNFFEDGLFFFGTYHDVAGHFHNNRNRDRVWARGFVQLSQFRGWFSWLTEEPEDEEALSGKCFEDTAPCKAIFEASDSLSRQPLLHSSEIEGRANMQMLHWQLLDMLLFSLGQEAWSPSEDN